MSKLPQDVEEFIAKHAYQDGHDRFSCRCVSVEALTDWMTDWMTGHVRVPVELLRKRFESPNTIDQCEAEAEFLALLNASKGE